MVKQEFLVHLLIGQGSVSKDLQIAKIKAELLDKKVSEFNSDLLYAGALDGRALQEKLLSLPLESDKRVLIIRDAQVLKKEAKEILLSYLSAKDPKTILILDAESDDPKDAFFSALKSRARVYRFEEDFVPGVFDLVRQVESARVTRSLETLHELIGRGVRPEFILGGLRSVSRFSSVEQSSRVMKFLLNCDLSIKTGKLKPSFALEKLVISLCGLRGSGKFAR
jgi:DNA polymerase III delta subunit